MSKHSEKVQLVFVKCLTYFLKNIQNMCLKKKTNMHEKKLYVGTKNVPCVLKNRHVLKKMQRKPNQKKTHENKEKKMKERKNHKKTETK